MHATLEFTARRGWRHIFRGVSWPGGWAWPYQTRMGCPADWRTVGMSTGFWFQVASFPSVRLNNGGERYRTLPWIDHMSAEFTQ